MRAASFFLPLALRPSPGCPLQYDHILTFYVLLISLISRFSGHVDVSRWGQDAVSRILGGNDKQTCRAIAERFEEKYDQSLVDALKKELRGMSIWHAT